MTTRPLGTPPEIDLSIAVIAYNGPQLLQATLATIEWAARDITFELFVVDNASTTALDDDFIMQFPEARLLRSERNLGFAGANNLALGESRGRYALLLNPDTLLPEGGLDALVSWMDAHPDVGAAGPLLLQPNGVPQPYSFGSAPTPRYLIRRLVSHVQGKYLHTWGGHAARLVDWVAGTCLIVRRQALAQVGLLDEQFFLYFEDVDWGLRFRQAGWQVMFVPTIAVTHIGGGSVGASAVEHYDRSLVRFYAKYYGRWAALGVQLALRCYRLGQRLRGPARHDEVT